MSGVTVALVLIPQSMAYAQLAGLPPYYGLYASFLPPMIASLFGSSRQLATGPVAIVSLMTAASLEPLATAGSPGYIAYAILLALTVGVLFGDNSPSPSRCLTGGCYHQEEVWDSGPRDLSRVPRGR